MTRILILAALLALSSQANAQTAPPATDAYGNGRYGINGDVTTSGLVPITQRVGGGNDVIAAIQQWLGWGGNKRP